MLTQSLARLLHSSPHLTKSEAKKLEVIFATVPEDAQADIEGAAAEYPAVLYGLLRNFEAKQALLREGEEIDRLLEEELHFLQNLEGQLEP